MKTNLDITISVENYSRYLTCNIVHFNNFECRLPVSFPKECNILLVDPMLATGIFIS
jgi:uracil phosphoribosyltransferase